MPVYTVPTAQPAENPILEAAKNFVKSPAYARQFVRNLETAMAPPGPAAGAMAAPSPGGHYHGDGHDHTNDPGLSPAAVAAFGLLSQSYPDLTVTSGYRSPEHNARVGGARNSQHTHGNAFDISTAGMSQPQVGALIDAAQAAGFRGVGVYPTNVHFDVGPARAWGPSYSRDSLPAWAVPYIQN
jgi:Peptidase M15